MVVITIGSDPEFIILDKHKELVSAFDFFTKECNGCNPCETCDSERGECIDKCHNDCDSCKICSYDSYKDCGECDGCDEQTTLYSSEIGVDSCEEVGELRPKYADNPTEHHSNIQHLIEQIDTDGGYILRAGTYVEDQSIGGHIHIGGFKQPSYGIDMTSFNEWSINMSLLSDYLSLYAGIPLRKIEHPKDMEYRGMDDGDYGFFGDMHHTEYGIEWRMPASWLVDSEIALSALSLAYVVVNEYTIFPETITCPPNKINMKKLLLKRSVNSIIKKVEGMKLYRTYSKEIEPLFQLISEGKKWKDKNNFKDHW